MLPAADDLRESLSHCHCNSLHNHWLHRPLEKPSHPSRVIAYVRQDGSSLSNDKQISMIETFCQDHGYDLIAVYQDVGPEPARGLTDALNALIEQAHGLIAVDLERFVHNHKDRLRDLRPLIYKFFCHTQRYLLTIAEGIDTSSPAGQMSAVEELSVTEDFE